METRVFAPSWMQRPVEAVRYMAQPQPVPVQAAPSAAQMQAISLQLPVGQAKRKGALDFGALGQMIGNVALEQVAEA